MIAFPWSLALLLALPMSSATACSSLLQAIVKVDAAAEPPFKLGEVDALLQEDTDMSSSLLQAVVKVDAVAGPPFKMGEENALLQENADMSHGVQPNPAGWFGGFDHGESTWDYDGQFAHDDDPTLKVADGWNPRHEDLSSSNVKDSLWFDETHSGGNVEAVQAYPPLTGSIAGNDVKTGKWFLGRGGKLQQDYLEGASLSDREKKEIPASWFDSSVKQLDGYGRHHFPAIGSPRNYLQWQERSVNTSLSCKTPGCIANISLLAPFNATKEQFKNCRMSVFFHPTDFDDQYSGEMVEWVQVNDKQVSANCRPFAQGCNQTAERPLLPCVIDLPIDLLMPKNGVLKIAAKIPKVVDECPYNGNLLSAVPMVTCLVAPKPDPQLIAARLPKPVQVSVSSVTAPKDACTTRVPFQCASRGCVSEIAISIHPTCAKRSRCMLSVNVSQTDFDNNDGTLEQIEYIKVHGKEVASKLKPGKNPCKSEWKGNATNSSDYSFVALKDHVVNASSGQVVVEGKISEYVDECASNGYLFDAVAQVTCDDKAA